jgi:hypothetical protein
MRVLLISSLYFDLKPALRSSGVEEDLPKVDIPINKIAECWRAGSPE